MERPEAQGSDAVPMMQALKQRLNEGTVTFLTLLTSTGTLVCCALPIMLVTLGLGSAVVGLTGAFPWLVTLSRHKAWVFAVSALLLAIGGWMLYRARAAVVRQIRSLAGFAAVSTAGTGGSIGPRSPFGGSAFLPRTSYCR